MESLRLLHQALGESCGSRDEFDPTTGTLHGCNGTYMATGPVDRPEEDKHFLMKWGWGEEVRRRECVEDAWEENGG